MPTTWLDPGFQNAAEICDLLRPYPAEVMRGYEVSRRVNTVANDDTACAAPVERANGASG
jgi:putative SOS response-associated peptidase YedK